MEIAESLKTLQFLSAEVWTRDKVLFADKLAPILPDILQTLLVVHKENESLRAENRHLNAMLDNSNTKIALLTRETDEAQKWTYFAGQRAAALIRIAEVLESLK